MTQIRQKAFSHRIEEYLHNSKSFDQQRFDSSLYQVIKQNKNLITSDTRSSRVAKVIRGLSFSEHIELVMILIDRAYRGLVDQTGTRVFALAIAKALQTYAEPLTDGDYACFPYPYFLLHGLGKRTIEAVVWQIEENSRVIHETLAIRAQFMEKFDGPVYLEQSMKMLMEEGATEDTSGICCYLTRASEQQPMARTAAILPRQAFSSIQARRKLLS